MVYYEKPKAEILEYWTQDVLCTSGGAQTSPVTVDDNDLFDWE